jgi:hypothetical protein
VSLTKQRLDLVVHDSASGSAGPNRYLERALQQAIKLKIHLHAFTPIIMLRNCILSDQGRFHKRQLNMNIIYDVFQH